MLIKRSFKEFPLLFLNICLYDIFFKGHSCGALDHFSKQQVIECPDPGFVRNANRFSGDGRPSWKNPTFQVNEILIYKCRRNFILTGSSYIRCLNSGSWSSRLPRCNRYNQRLRIIPRVKTCPDPGFVQNARRVAENNWPSLEKKEFQANETLLYECKEGFFLDGPSTITCHKSGSWSSPLPNCKPQIKTCPDPGLLRNTISFGISYSNKDNKFFEDKLKEGFLCYYAENYFNQVSIICQLSGSFLPRCLLRSKNLEACCYDPELLTNLTVPRREACPTYHSEDILEFSCNDDGLYILGKSLLTCMPSGKWSDPVPICVNYSAILPEAIENIPYGDLCFLKYFPRNVITTTTIATSEAPKRDGEENNTLNLNILAPDGGFMTYAKPANKSQFPWVVAISNLTKYGDFEIICSGTLLNRNTIVTAAHCLDTLTLNKTRLYFGKHHRSDSYDNGFVQVAMPTQFLVHPDYNKTSYDSDIAIIKFHPSITYTTYVNHACISLPTAPLSEKHFNETYFGVVAGWGMTEKHLYSLILQYAWIPIVPSEICFRAFKKLKINVTLSSNILCAGDKEGSVGPCKADSGSGLLFPKDDGQSLVLVGIVSFGAYPECERTNQYDFFTNVANFVPWIRAHL